MKLLAFILLMSGLLYAEKAAGQATDSIIAPNIFTPNGDGKNDVFEVEVKLNNTTNNSQPVTLKIYTRAGVLVFSTKAQRCRWDGCADDGSKLPNGVYFYTAEATGSSSKLSKSGFVHLFR